MFSSDGKQVVTASSDETARVWDTATGKLIATLNGHKAAISYAVFSPDGQFVATVSEDKTAKIWDAKTGKQVWNLKGHDGHVFRCGFSPTGRTLVTGSTDKTAKAWDVATGKLLWTTPAHQASVALVMFSPDGKEVLTVAPMVTLWDAASGKFLKEPKENHEWNYTPLFTVDGRYRYRRGDQNTLIIYDGITNQQLWTLPGHTDTLVEGSFSSDGAYIATASMDGTAMIWQLPAPTAPPKPKAPANLVVRALTFSDKNGNNNNVLDAGESATIAFTLVNSGKGNAYGAVAEIKTLVAATGLDYSFQTKIGNVNAGDSIVVRIPITGTQTVESGKPEFELRVKEGNGFDADPVRISFMTQKFKNPQLTIVDHKFTTDHGGKIKPGQAVALEIIVQNRGQGDASDIKANFNTPSNVFPGTEANFTIDKLKPNQTKNLRYEFFANKMYTAKDIPIEVGVTESYNKYGEKKVLTVSLDQTLPDTQTLTVAGQTDEVVKIDNVSLRPQVDNSVQEQSTPEEVHTISGAPVFYSLFIGVERYQFTSASLGNLNKPVKDATALKNVLVNNYTFPEKNSVFLTNPTRAEIIRAFEDLAVKITPKDNLLVFYAGHGFWNDKLKIGYWLPSDSKPDDKSTWITNSTITEYIAGIQSKHTLLITDACFGGSIFKTREVTAEINEFAVSKIYKLPSRKAMTSGTLTIVPDDSKFMEFLLKRLSDNASPYLTARQLFHSLEIAVMNNTTTVPQLGVIQGAGDEGGDFVFMKKK